MCETANMVKCMGVMAWGFTFSFMSTEKPIANCLLYADKKLCE